MTTKRTRIPANIDHHAWDHTPCELCGGTAPALWVTNHWTAIETDNGFALCMDGEIVRDGYDQMTAYRKAYEANTAEVAAARIATTETDPEARFGRKEN